MDVGGRRLEDDLQLVVLFEAVRILAVSAVCRSPGRLDVGDPVGFGSEHPQECFGMHGARADFDVIGLLQNAALPAPEIHHRLNEILKVHRSK